jgi:predicted nucleotidyltransferase
LGQGARRAMNAKQATAIQIVARWADRFGCVTRAVIYGSVARGDEKPTSDLDVDLEYVSDLTAPGMTKSYDEAHASFDNLCDDLFKAIGHRLRVSSYDKHHPDTDAKDWIKSGTEIGSAGKARMVTAPPKPKNE